MNPHSRVAFLPYVPYTRKVLIYKGTRTKPGKPPETVGEHVLAKRLAEGLDRKALAPRLGVDESTLMNWELGRTKVIPAVSMPAVIAFLGFNPEREPQGVGARLRWKRRALGWTAREAARMNSVDPSTWETWEQMTDWPKYPRYKAFLAEFLELSRDVLLASVRTVPPPPTQEGQKRT